MYVVARSLEMTQFKQPALCVGFCKYSTAVSTLGATSYRSFKISRSGTASTDQLLCTQGDTGSTNWKYQCVQMPMLPTDYIQEETHPKSDTNRFSEQSQARLVN